MKGILFNLLEEVVTSELGEDAWEDLIERAEVEGVYTSLGSYPDEDFMRLLGATPGLAGSSQENVLRWFGRASIPLLAKRYSGFFEGHRTTSTFLRTLNDIIHPEVRKLYPGADVPTFDFDSDGGSNTPEVVMGYRSARRLCALAEGFILGAADHFGERVVIEQTQCMNRGDERCLLVCRFTPMA